MNTATLRIELFSEKIPVSLLAKSGKVFYSGRNAFSYPSSLYVLGVNPGGDPADHETETIESHTQTVLHGKAADWSEYRDESWEKAPPGTYGMAPRVLHLFKELGISPGSIPCSNLVFVRSRREGDLKANMSSLADQCWSFHDYVIERLHPRIILCFGKTSGNYVRNKVSANKFIGEFVENNKRRWRSQEFSNAKGLTVIVATHPSIADWTAPSTDPTQLVRDSLQRPKTSS